MAALSIRRGLRLRLPLLIAPHSKTIESCSQPEVLRDGQFRINNVLDAPNGRVHLAGFQNGGERLLEWWNRLLTSGSHEFTH